MMKPVPRGESQLVDVMDRPLGLVFRQVPQNICLYFLWTKPDIWAHLTYRDARSFIIRLMLTNLGVPSVLLEKLMEKNGSWRSEYGYFITVKCPLCGTDGSKKKRLRRGRFATAESGWWGRKWFLLAATEGQYCQVINQYRCCVLMSRELKESKIWVRFICISMQVLSGSLICMGCQVPSILLSFLYCRIKDSKKNLSQRHLK